MGKHKFKTIRLSVEESEILQRLIGNVEMRLARDYWVVKLYDKLKRTFDALAENDPDYEIAQEDTNA